jgi:hypothetical protein
MRLVYETNGVEVKVGDIAIDFRGDQHRVKALHEPHKPSSSGHVTTDVGYFYVGVIGAEWIEREDR